MSTDNLARLAERVGGFVRKQPGDVCALVLGDGREVVNEDDTFDLWRDDLSTFGGKRLTEHHSLSEDEIVALIQQEERA